MTLQVRDLMVPDPVTLDPGDTLRFASGVLTSIGAGGAPVLKADRVIGVLSMTDILDFAANHPTPAPPDTRRRDLGEETQEEADTAMAAPEGPEWDVLDEHTVAEVMSMRVLALPPAASVTEAAQLMESAGVRRILVMEGPQLVGILTARDLVQAMARGDLVPREPA